MAREFSDYRQLVVVGITVVASLIATFVVATGRAEADAGGGGRCDVCHKPPSPTPKPRTGKDGWHGEAVLMDHRGDVADSGAGSSCADCEWRLKAQCKTGDRHICDGDATCAPEEPGGRNRTIFDVMLMRTNEPWHVVNSFCMTDEKEVVTTKDVGRRVVQTWDALVPKQQVTSQPPDGRTLVNLPTYFDSGQPKAMPPTPQRVFDFTIQVSARGEWHWRFDSGVAPKTFEVPGSTYDGPDKTVQYTYQTAGQRNVQLDTYWYGSFTVNGYGPYNIDEPVHQGPTTIPLTVLESGGHLSGN